MTTKIPPDLSLHEALVNLVDQSRAETINTQMRLEQQVQQMDSQFLNERMQRSTLTGRLTEQTHLAEQLQLKLAAEQKKTVTLTEQIQILQQKEHILTGQLDHEKAIQGDLERRLQLTNEHVEILNQQLTEFMRASFLQNQLIESNRRHRAAQCRDLVLVPCQILFQMSSSSGGALLGTMIAGPLGSAIGCMAGMLSSTLINQMATQQSQTATSSYLKNL